MIAVLELAGALVATALAVAVTLGAVGAYRQGVTYMCAKAGRWSVELRCASTAAGRIAHAQSAEDAGSRLPDVLNAVSSPEDPGS